MNKTTVTKLIKNGWLKPVTKAVTITQRQADKIVLQVRTR